jgi:hypothetical protein
MQTPLLLPLSLLGRRREENQTLQSRLGDSGWGLAVLRGTRCGEHLHDTCEDNLLFFREPDEGKAALVVEAPFAFQGLLAASDEAPNDPRGEL